MKSSLRTLSLGAGLAVTLAVIAIVPTIAGISTWKWVLGLLGLVFFVLAGRSATR